MFDEEPIIGQWYLSDSASMSYDDMPFQVIDVDYDEEIIEIQFVDGTLGEIEFNTWDELRVKECDESASWAMHANYDDNEFLDTPRHYGQLSGIGTEPELVNWEEK